MDNFGQTLKRYRRERCLTLDDLAKALGVSKPTIWAWEHSKSRPKPERYEALAEVLKVPVESFICKNSDEHAKAELVKECKEKIAEAFSLHPSAICIRIKL